MVSLEDQYSGISQWDDYIKRSRKRKSKKKTKRSQGVVGPGDYKFLKWLGTCNESKCNTKSLNF